MINRTFAAFVLITLAFCLAAYGQDDTRIAATWQVVKYDIAATLPQTDTSRNLAAKAKLDLRNVSSRPASTLTLRIAPTAEVSGVTVNGSSNEFTKGEEKAGAGSLQRIVIRMPSVAPGAGVAVAVDYTFNVKENTGLSAISPAGSQFLPLSFWYPTPNSWFFARGADNAPVRLQVTAGAGVSIVSAGTEAGGVYESKLNGQPFFAAGNWDLTNANGVGLYLPKGSGAEEQKRAAELAAIASESRTYFESIFGKATDSPVRLAAVSRGAGFSSGGTITFDQAVLRRPRVDAQTAMSVADGVAKMWLGGMVTISGDGGGAVKEGLSRYLATQFIEQKFGKDVADLERLRQRVAYAAVVQRDAPISTVAPLDDYYYSVVANKGAMIWRLLNQKAGSMEFATKLKGTVEDNAVSLAEIRAAFPEQKEFLDYAFDKTTDTNLLAGLPQQGSGEWKVALRNTGAVDVTVDVEAVLDNGQRMSAPATVRATNFGEVVFRTPNKVTRVEIDRQKLYPQTDFSDDVAPRELTDSDPLLAVKRYFDKQDFANAEKTAKLVLSDYPRFDDVRILLARSLLALNRNADAEREFRAVLEEKLPTSRSLGWALVGLGEIAARNNQNDQAARFAADAIRADAEYGASLAARSLRNRIGAKTAAEPTIAAYFDQWDRAAAGNQKAQLDALVAPGEATRFSSGVAGQTAAWKTQIVHIDQIDPNTALVETSLSIKLLNRDPESGMAVFRLSRAGGGWKLVSVDVFEVR